MTKLVDPPRATIRGERWSDFLEELLVRGQLDDPEKQNAETRPAGLTPVRQPFHILIVDDDVSIRTTLTAFLEDEGYSVDAAINGAEALECVARQRPSLILLDMRMPVMDGWAFAGALRARGIAVPLVVMTAARDARRWAEEIGATAYVAKPFDLPELLNKLADLCA
jgi:CheY-like chemotaxis protein